MRFVPREIFELETNPPKIDKDALTTGDKLRISSDFLLVMMMPFISLLGAQGWEVIEYKTGDEPPFFQALLKRKITT